MNVFVAFKWYISIQISIVTRDNTADMLDFYVENAEALVLVLLKVSGGSR